MKKIILLLFVTALIACNNEPKIDYAIITGTIENAEKPEAKLYSTYSMDIIKEITLDENGTFLDTIKIEDSNLFAFRHNNRFTEFYVEKGDSLHINYDFKKAKETTKVTGTSSNAYEYIVDKYKKETEILGQGTDIYKKEEAAYKEAQQKLKKAKEDLLFNYQGLSNKFRDKERRSINYAYLSNLNIYERYHSYYAKKGDFKVSENFLSELDNLEYDNEADFLFSISYRNLVDGHINNEVAKFIKKDSLKAREILKLEAIAKIENQKIKNKLLYDEAKYGITYTNNLEEFYTIYEANSTNKENNTKIKESYTNLKKLAKGSPSPQFKDYENYAGGTTSSRDLKGKYVYIDVWATWCGPCIAEIPSLKKVEKQFHNEDIQFLSISIDDKKDYDKWRKMIADKELGGMQLMAENAWDSKFVKDFMIKGIPRFILLDKEGNIIDANAPRPSNKKLVDVLSGLNSKNDLKLQP